MPPVIAAVSAIVTTVSTAVSTAITAISAFTGLSTFLVQAIGSLVLGIGISLIASMFVKKPQAPTTEAAKINVRVNEPDRWHGAGQARSGGGVLFAEFDNFGNFWYIVVHSDSILNSIHKVFFDDVEITLSGTEVVTNEFNLDSKNNLYTGTGARVNCFNIWTRTYTTSNPVPPAVAEFVSAFPTLWTAQHKLAGTTYSVVKIKSLSAEHRNKIYKWRGPIGLGEPAISIVGNWSTAYDPRNSAHVPNNPATYTFTRNPILIWAWFRMHPYGRNKPFDSINWEKVAEQAAICDEIITDLNNNNVTRYRCDIMIPESKERYIAEQEIMMCCDGQLVFDDDGKCWLRAGYYYQPNLKLVRNRDIIAMESVEAQNGESLTQGVIVGFTDPDSNYSRQSSAAWINPIYFKEGETPKFLVIDALGVQSHNQAMRLAKSIGLRSQSSHKLLPTVGLRGLRARQERIVKLLYDNTFSGDYEIVTPVEVDPMGVFCGFGVVPIDADRFKLLPGEEKQKPERKSSEQLSPIFTATNVVLTYRNNRIEATFDPALRPDQRYIFQYQKDIGSLPLESNWADFAVNMNENTAFSGGVESDRFYYVRHKAVSNGGRSSSFSENILVDTSRITLTGTPILTGEVGTPYASFVIGASGGRSPYIFSDVYDRLPPGVTINASTGLISGIPTTDGTFADIIIRVVDADNFAKNFAAFTINVI